MSRPVVVVCGWSNLPAHLDATPILTRLRAELGPELVLLPALADPWGSIDANAAALIAPIRGFFDRCRSQERTSAVHFDLVGYGMGGLIARSLVVNFAAGLGSYRVRNIVTLGTPHQGAAGLLPQFTKDVGFGDDAGRSTTARTQMQPGSAYLTTLNSRALPAAVLVTTIAGSLRAEAAGAPPDALGTDGCVPATNAQLGIPQASSIIAQRVLEGVYYSRGVGSALVAAPNPKALTRYGSAGATPFTGTPLDGTSYLDDDRVIDALLGVIRQAVVLEVSFQTIHGTFLNAGGGLQRVRAAGAADEPETMFTLVDRDGGTLRGIVNLVAFDGHLLSSAPAAQVVGGAEVPSAKESFTLGRLRETVIATPRGPAHRLLQPDDGSAAAGGLVTLRASTGTYLIAHPMPSGELRADGNEPGPNVVVFGMPGYAASSPGAFRLGIRRRYSPELPETGLRVRELAVFDYVMRRYMLDRGIPAGLLAVMRGDRIVMSRAYGHADRERRRPLLPAALMRIGSCDKPIAKAVMLDLIGRNPSVPGPTATLRLDTPVFPFLRAAGLTPPPGGAARAELDAITVQHLLNHNSGLGGVGSQFALATLLGITGHAPASWDHARWLMTQPLRYAPPANATTVVNDPASGRPDYINVGYDLARLVIGRVRRLADARYDDARWFLESVRSVAEATGGSRQDFGLTRDLPAQRHPREPWYSSRNVGPNVARLDPSDIVPVPDGGMNLEGIAIMTASADGLVRFMRAYHLGTGTRLVDPATGAWAAVPDNGASYATGAFDGTFAVMMQRRWDQLSVAAIFNQGYDAVAAPDDFNDIYPAMEDAIADVVVWP